MNALQPVIPQVVPAPQPELQKQPPKRKVTFYLFIYYCYCTYFLGM